MAAALLIATLVAITAGTLLRERQLGLFNPVIMFTAVNALMGVSTAVQLDLTFDSDVKYAFAIAITAVMFLVGVLLSDVFNSRLAIPRKPTSTASSIALLIGLNLFSLAMVLIYFRATGGLLVFKTLAAVASGRFAALDVASLRFSYYSQQFTAPGFFNQFKNFLYPYSATALLMLGLLSHRRWLIALGGASLLLASLFLIGTGQRTFLVMFAVGFFLLCTQFAQDARSVRRMMVIGGLAAAGLYVFSTFSLKRYGASGLEGVVMNALDRIVGAQPRGSVLAFRYMDGLPITYGREYLDTFLGLLPSHRGSTFSNEVFARAFGTMRGTMPYSVWGGLYHNFGWIGLIVGPLLIGFGAARAHLAFLSGQRDPARVAAYAAIFACLGLWVAGGPMYLILNGVMAGVAWLSMIAMWRLYSRPRAGQTLARGHSRGLRRPRTSSDLPSEASHRSPPSAR